MTQYRSCKTCCQTSNRSFEIPNGQSFKLWQSLFLKPFGSKQEKKNGNFFTL
jgi:hypothetical protein